MSEELMELTLKQLKEKAKESGLDEAVANSLTTKAQIIGVLAVLKDKTKLVDPATSAMETPKEKKLSDKAWLSKRDRMGRHLEEQPKVSFMIPLSPGEKAGIVESRVVNGIREFKHISGAVKEKNINGFKWVLPKGVMTKVPEQVCELLSREMNVMATLGKDVSLDRIDRKTNRPVRDAL